MRVKNMDDYKELYEREKIKRQELQEKLDNIRNAIWDLISDDLYKHFKVSDESD